ncbi:AcrR family transcriptional regulator [Microbacterium resistens]|uniref:AcrR family transcriptional regulator n=1 Tax=Microbacterium resistens TaxID=156977 RepID=A0ABU1SER1_9MICO|nr:TetR/AcrR family transcriptional regulator [Microbacterium resistens]MDR6868093.1 AcrR family transcriptional regulator [Microbacterium resistens]
MGDVATRAERASTDKFAARRRELADSALAAIAERGYARTGLRDVAAHSDLSHGSLHYYFEDKDDLISQAIWQYKSECARRYDPIVETSASAEELARRFGDEMAATLRDEADMHRLWYDLRNQALFDDGFRDTIVAIDVLLQDMVWMVVLRYGELSGRTPVIAPVEAYALFDGLFLNCLIAFLRGDLSALDRIRASSPRLLAAAV